MSRRWPVLALFGFWSLLIWGTRIDNIWADAGLTTSAKWGRTALAASFVLTGVAVLAMAWRTYRSDGPESDAVVRAVVGGAAVWTIGVWVIRGTAIAIGDHDTAFIVVHVVLAVLSIALATWALFAVRSGEPIAATAAADATPVAS